MARFKSLPGFRSLPWLALTIVLLCALGSPPPVEAQTTVTNTMPTTPCVKSIQNFYFPAGTPATFRVVNKILTGPKVCTTAVATGGATCSTTASGLAAQAAATGNPSCQWNCVGCGTIITNATTDGLPVELMDFEVVDGDQEAEPGEEAGAAAETDAEPSER